MSIRKSLGVPLCGAVCLGAAWIGGCVVDAGLGPGGAFVTFTVLGKTFTLSFSDIGPITTQANETVSVPTAVRLFDETPPEIPPTGQMTLPSTSVGVARRLTAKTASRSQALPLNGSATIKFRIAPGQSAALCDTAVLLAEFDLSLTMGIAAIQNEVYDLSRAAMDAMMVNEVTICIEITADFDGDITIGDYFFAFGGGASGNIPPVANPPAPLQPGGLLQVPIDNRNGRAVAAPVNRIVAGVVYGIVGVIEDKTAAVTVPAVDPSSVTVVPAELGLLSVNTVYIGTHSSFVADVADSVTIATLTINYTTGLTPTVLELVTGSTTAEWSYDRPAHTTMYGGVQHVRAPVLHSFETLVDSTTPYNGYSYSAAIPIDNIREISSISVSMADPATYAASRVVTGSLTEWASQALTAITLVGQPLILPTEACCFNDGECEDIRRTECEDRSGTPGGENSLCDDTECLGACCISGPCVVSTGECGSCEMATRDICDGAFGGDYMGLGVACEPWPCRTFDVEIGGPDLACCFPPTPTAGGSCTDYPFDICVELDGDPQSAGTTCAERPCPEACCFDNGTCLDLVPADCENEGGTPGGVGTECDSLECLGACCDPDGCCELRSADDCDTRGSEYMGFAIDCEPDPCPEAYTCYTIINFPASPVSKYRTVQPACSLDSGKLLSAFPGGGSDPAAPALFNDDIMPGRSFSTREAAAAECCKGLTDYVDDPAFILTAKLGGIQIGIDRIILDECDDLGACCTSDGNCTDASKADCTALASGVLGPTEFKGPGTNCTTADCPPPPEYVVWYTSNVCCWGAPYINITDRAGFEAPDLRRNWSGGGLDPVDPLTKTELQGGFATVDDAKAWLCPQFTSWTFHFWCGSHTQGPLGGNWQGTAGCSFDPPLPQAEVAPEFNGCP